MCGIFGLYNSDGLNVDIRILNESLDMQRSRGPDSGGIKIFDNAVLAWGLTACGLAQFSKLFFLSEE